MRYKAETPLRGRGLLVDFAHELRALRIAARVTYRQMATPSVARMSLCDAASGMVLPSSVVLRTFVQACGGDVDYWLEQREQLADARKRGEKLRVAWPSELSDFLQALAFLRRSKGVSLKAVASDYFISLNQTRALLRVDAADVPPYPLVMCVVELCGGDIAEWRKRWDELARLCKKKSKDEA